MAFVLACLYVIKMKLKVFWGNWSVKTLEAAFGLQLYSLGLLLVGQNELEFGFKGAVIMTLTEISMLI